MVILYSVDNHSKDPRDTIFETTISSISSQTENQFKNLNKNQAKKAILVFERKISN